MRALALFAVASLAGMAHAGTFNEVESNNSLVLANDLGSFDAPGDSVIISANLGANDVDWFGFTLLNDATLSVFAAFGSGDGDGAMQIVSSAGVVLAFDDDSGVGLMPALQLMDLSAGTYYIAFSGFDDADDSSVGTTNVFDGLGHDESFSYKLSVGFSIVPAPSSAALLGLGGLVAFRRRR